MINGLFGRNIYCTTNLSRLRDKTATCGSWDCAHFRNFGFVYSLYMSSLSCGHVPSFGSVEARDRITEYIDWFKTENGERADRDRFPANNLFIIPWLFFFLGHKFNAVSEYRGTRIWTVVILESYFRYRGNRARLCEGLSNGFCISKLSIPKFNILCPREKKKQIYK